MKKMTIIKRPAFLALTLLMITLLAAGCSRNIAGPDNASINIPLEKLALAAEASALSIVPTALAESTADLAYPTTADTSPEAKPSAELQEDAPAEPAKPAAGGMTADFALAASLLDDINTTRAANGNNALAADETLAKIAFAYAEELYSGGWEFRNMTEFHYLPSGKQVYSLFAGGYEESFEDFGYSVWYNSNGNGETGFNALDDYMKGTNLYQTRAIAGDYTKMGIACATATDNSDPYTVVIMMCLKD